MITARRHAINLVLAVWLAVAALGVCLPWEDPEPDGPTRGMEMYGGVLMLAVVIFTGWAIALRLADGVSQRLLDAFIASWSAVGLAVMVWYYAAQHGRTEGESDTAYFVHMDSGFYITAAALALMTGTIVAKYAMPALSVRMASLVRPHGPT